MVMKKCPKCGCEAIDRGRITSAGAIAYKSDKHFCIFKSNCKAYVCTDCGYAEIYVDSDYLDRIRDK